MVLSEREVIVVKSLQNTIVVKGLAAASTLVTLAAVVAAGKKW